MKIKNKKGTYLHGIAAAEGVDSSGERVSITGMDISSLTVDGTFTWEHELQGKLPSTTVGKIFEARKILKESDCINDHHKYFWNKCKIPFLYVAGELLDGVGHEGAKEVAAMLDYDQELDTKKTKPLINFSIEGNELQKDGSDVKKSIARKVTITIRACNKICVAEKMEKQGTPLNKKFDKKSIIDKIAKSEICKYEVIKNPGGEITSRTNKAPITVKDKGHSTLGKPSGAITTQGSGKLNVMSGAAYKAKMSTLHKSIVASCGNVMPSAKTGMAAISKEEMSKVCKSLSQESYNLFNKKDELIQFISSKIPTLSKTEVEALAKTVSYVWSVKKELTLQDLLNG